MSSGTLFAVVIIVAFALIFNFINGFHDTANSIATCITTKSLTPMTAIVMASLLELAGSLFSTKVAETIGKDIINPQIIDFSIMFSAILAAIIWNLLTWYRAIPSSSSHALIGGLIGASIIKTLNFSPIYWRSFIFKIVLPLFLAPIIGFICGAMIMVMLMWILKPFKLSPVNSLFSKLQIISSGFVAFSHGANDAQKSMGIIALALMLSNPLKTFEIPLWVQLSCAITLALGTATGGWKIIKTMGNKICKLKPVSGFAAQSATALVINSATFLIGAPVSTTHIISTAIMGVGSSNRLSSVKWKIASSLLIAWFITIPSTALIAGFIQQVLKII